MFVQHGANAKDIHHGFCQNALLADASVYGSGSDCCAILYESLPSSPPCAGKGTSSREQLRAESGTHHPTISSSVVLIGLQHELLKAKTRCMSSLCRLPPFKRKLKDKRFQGALGVPILRRPLELKNGCHRRCLQSSAKPWKPRDSIQLSAYKRLSRRSSQLRGPRCKQGW